MTTPVNPDQLRVSIEMGDQYAPSDRLRTALDELCAALAESDDAEVTGFLIGDEAGVAPRTFQFDSSTGGFKVGSGYKDTIQPKNRVFKY